MEGLSTQHHYQGGFVLGGLGAKGWQRDPQTPLVGSKVAKLIRRKVSHTWMLAPQRAHPHLPAHLLTQAARGGLQGSSVPVTLGEPCSVPGLCLSRVVWGTLGFSGHERDLVRSRGCPAPTPGGFLFTIESPAPTKVLDVVDAQ